MAQANATLRNRLVAANVELQSLAAALKAAGDHDLAAYVHQAQLELRGAQATFAARNVSDNALRR